MGRNTGISWCDATYNPWRGCTEVTRGCDNCYARILSKKVWNQDWGHGVARFRPSQKYLNQPYQWDRAAHERGKPLRVFAASVADIYDPEVPRQWLTEFLSMTFNTEYIQWLILTKRPGLVTSVRAEYCYDHTWIGTSIATNEDWPLAKAVSRLYGKYRWLSIEPLLEDIEIEQLPRGIDWVVVGGESGDNARECKIEWIRHIVEYCQKKSVPVFVKQLGRRPYFAGLPWPITDKKGGNTEEWPTDLRVQQFPLDWERNQYTNNGVPPRDATIPR